MILEDSALITSSSLPADISRPNGHAPHGTPASREIHDEQSALEDSERRLVASALELTGGNQTQAARLPGGTHDMLRHKQRKHSLP
jgi:DNA-binding NtrC family response regulator